MNERERLIELLNDWESKENDSFPAESIADCLLENGVVVLPKEISTKQDLKEPMEVIKTALEYEDKGIIVASCKRGESDICYRGSVYCKGKNRPCREAIAYILSEFIDTEKGNLEWQLTLVKFFKVTLHIIERRLKGGNENE